MAFAHFLLSLASWVLYFPNHHDDRDSPRAVLVLPMGDTEYTLDFTLRNGKNTAIIYHSRLF